MNWSFRPVRLHNAAFIAVGLFHALLWIGGVLSYLVWGGPPSGSEWAAPFFLLTAAVLILFSWPARNWGWLFWAGIVGYSSEVLGVTIGAPYGGYRYRDVLGPKMAGAPLVMICAWITLAAYVRDWLRRRGVHRRWRIWIGAFSMTTLDLLIDPLAAGPLGYWEWLHPGAYYGIPLSNFVGWFLVSAIVFLPAGADVPAHPVLRSVGIGIVAFFGVLALAYQFWIPALVATGWIAAEGWVSRTDQRTFLA